MASSIIGSTDSLNNDLYPKVLAWIPLQKPTMSLPAGAVGGGYTEEGEPTYVGRHQFLEQDKIDCTCGAYIPSLKLAALPFGGRGGYFTPCDILVCRDLGILFWVDAEGGHVPDLAVGVGNDPSLDESYVARSRPGAKLSNYRTYRGKKVKISKNFTGPMLGMLIPREGAVYLVHNKSEIVVDKYQILCAYRLPSLRKHSYSWITGSNGHLPEGSIAGGMTDEGEPTYIARVLTQRSTHNYRPSSKYTVHVAGYVVPSEKICHYSTDSGTSESKNNYDAFIPMTPSCFQWQIPVSIHGTRNVVFVDDTRYDTASMSVNNFAVGRTTPGATLLPSSPILSQEKIEQAKVIGTFHSIDNYLSVSYKGQHYTTTQFEVLVALNVPHTLLELSRYAVLRYTNAVPDRVDKLPLPERMKLFCQLKQE